MTRFGGAAEDSCKNRKMVSPPAQIPDNHLAKNGIVCYCKNCTEMGSLRKAG